MAYIGFEDLTKKLRKQGHSADSAKRIAASIGRAKYGAKKFNKAAATGTKLGP